MTSVGRSHDGCVACPLPFPIPLYLFFFFGVTFVQSITCELYEKYTANTPFTNSTKTRVYMKNKVTTVIPPRPCIQGTLHKIYVYAGNGAALASKSPRQDTSRPLARPKPDAAHATGESNQGGEPHNSSKKEKRGATIESDRRGQPNLVALDPPPPRPRTRSWGVKAVACLLALGKSSDLLVLVTVGFSEPRAFIS